MMSITARGIYHNLNDSEYAISNTDIAFFFSSKTYLNKFMEEHDEFRLDFRKRLERVIELNEENTDLLADIHFYRDIEKRGFRVESLNYISTEQGVRRGINWQELHRYALVKMTEKNTTSWSLVQGEKLNDFKINLE